MTVIASTVPKARFDQFNITVPNDWTIKFLNDDATEEQMIEEARDAEFFLVTSVQRVSAKVIQSLTKLRLLHVDGVGFNGIDVAAATEVGLPVCNNRGVNASAVAEFAVGAMIAGLRRMMLIDRETKAGRFAECQKAYRATGVNEMSSRHVGIIGCGAIGRNVARLLKPFGCKLYYFDERRPSPEVEKELGVVYLELNELLKTCDIISLHVPLLPDTINLISGPQIEMMKPSAMIVNTSRGEAVDQYALAEALETGRIYAAVIDTLFPEPPENDHPLLRLSPEAQDRLLLTPHTAGTTNEVFEEELKMVIVNIQRELSGESLKNCVNGMTHGRKTAGSQLPCS
jgi:phosphoglycerate dehydrogenase-like enzyme